MALAGLLAFLAAVDHPYCGRSPTPPVPPVPVDERAGLRLASAAAVIRHGARTPQAAFECWPGFDASATAWQCEQPESKVALGGLDFDVVYGGARMVLGARTHCAAGQLLDEGRAQLRALGASLRAAYVGNNATIAPLLPEAVPRFGETGVALRSSTAPRAMASGQELIVGLLTPPSAPGTAAAVARARADHPIRWEVAEHDMDWLWANPGACPRLDTIAAEAEAAFAADREAVAADKAARHAVASAVGEGDLASLRGNPALDCLMASTCGASAQDAGSSLPKALRVDGPLHEQAWTALQASFARLMLHANASWSKLAMARVLEELRAHTRGAVDGLLGRPKLALWSGHDSTIMPLLSALGVYDGLWAKYAANLLVEIWLPAPGAQAGAEGGAREPHVRLLYDGKVITHRLAGCAPNASLCPFAAFEAVVAPLALDDDGWEHACRPPAGPPTLLRSARQAPGASASVGAMGSAASRRTWPWVSAAMAACVLVMAAIDAVREGGAAANRRIFGRVPSAQATGWASVQARGARQRAGPAWLANDGAREPLVRV